ncbi:GNAT family N-acetyltransferase [Pararhizobium haloflavum]|uniref:GNAT family N-acetyltransferase n=1 Tax=Pararhizobium haloflavum TaxID=2037914 RepID=UPI000C17EC67|nr:GNAT family protein [Pararhizobium haloflavum]
MRDLRDWKGCLPPKRQERKGRFVTLEPFDPARHLEELWIALGGKDGINERLRYFPCPDFADAAELGTWLVQAQDGWVTFVFRDNAAAELTGMASYMRIDPGNGVVEVGSVAHGLAMARSPAATEVHYLMARHIFDDLGYRRYEWKCHNDNAASKRTAERLGFVFEGIFRQHVVSKGANRDTAWFAMIDTEWPIIRSAMEQWLAPGNFDADGRQIERLEIIRARQIAPQTEKAI